MPTSVAHSLMTFDFWLSLDGKGCVVLLVSDYNEQEARIKELMGFATSQNFRLLPIWCHGSFPYIISDYEYLDYREDVVKDDVSPHIIEHFISKIRSLLELPSESHVITNVGKLIEDSETVSSLSATYPLVSPTSVSLVDSSILHDKWQEIDSVIKHVRELIDREEYGHALECISGGIKKLQTFHQDAQRISREIDLYGQQGLVFASTKGYASESVREAFDHANALVFELSTEEWTEKWAENSFLSLRGQWMFYFVKAELNKARDIGKIMLTMAGAGNRPDFLIEAHQALGASFSRIGLLDIAYERYYAPGWHVYEAYGVGQDHIKYYGEEPGVILKAELGFIQWLRGYSDEAQAHALSGVVLAREKGHLLSLAHMLCYCALVLCWRHEATSACMYADECISISHEKFPVWEQAAISAKGMALIEQGDPVQGIELLEQATESWRGTGARVNQTDLLVTLAEAYIHIGRYELAQARLEETLYQIKSSGERYYEAETHRVWGELLIARGDESSKAEASFLTALKLAQEQGAKSLALRATISLAQLWQKDGRRSEAREKLTEVYKTFSEGFGTTDLRKARELIKQLS
jgi:tetratricopeptide (TPR) repeat protein